MSLSRPFKGIHDGSGQGFYTEILNATSDLLLLKEKRNLFNTRTIMSNKRFQQITSTSVGESSNRCANGTTKPTFLIVWATARLLKR